MHRKKPGSLIHEADDADQAVDVAKAIRCCAAIAHRTFDATGPQLVKVLRTAASQMPIIMVSGMNRAEEAKAAGADAFLLYDEWLRLGGIVERVIAGAAPKTAGELV